MSPHPTPNLKSVAHWFSETRFFIVVVVLLDVRTSA